MGGGAGALRIAVFKVHEQGRHFGKRVAGAPGPGHGACAQHAIRAFNPASSSAMMPLPQPFSIIA